MTSFALKTLLADRGKLLTGLAGVIFSLVLVNMQGGLCLGLLSKASLLIDNTDADIWIGHRQIENVDFAHDIPSAWKNRIHGLPEIRQVDEYIVGKGMCTLPNGGYEDVWVVGSEPVSMRGSGWKFSEGGVDDLHRPNGVSIDDVDAVKLGYPKVGDWLEVNSKRTKIVARTSGITGFVTTPYLFTTLSTARELSMIPEGYCSYLLVKSIPGADQNRLRDKIAGFLPDADVYTPSAFAELSRTYWMKRTGIGISFGASTMMGLFVGLVMVAQSLYALALDHLTDYATLKAIGAEDRQVYRIIALQSLTVATIGSIIGMSIVFVIRRFWSSPIAPLLIPPEIQAAAIILVVLICVVSSVLPFRRLRRVDPAVVLQG